MREGAWNQHAAHCTLLANCNRNPKKQKAFKFTDFHPFVRKRKPVPNRYIGKGEYKEMKVLLGL